MNLCYSENTGDLCVIAILKFLSSTWYLLWLKTQISFLNSVPLSPLCLHRSAGVWETHLTLGLASAIWSSSSFNCCFVSSPLCLVSASSMPYRQMMIGELSLKTRADFKKERWIEENLFRKYEKLCVASLMHHITCLVLKMTADITDL